MQNYWKRFFTSRPYTPHEIIQRKRTLDYILWIIGVIGILLGILNLVNGAGPIGLFVFTLAPVCVFALYLNRKGRYTIAAVFVSTLMLIIIDADIYDVGGLTGDLAPVAYPVLIVVCSLLFRKRGIYIFSILSILSVIALGVAEMLGLSPTALGSTDISDIITVIVLILGVSVLQWVIINNFEENFQSIKHNEIQLRASWDLTLEGWAKALEARDQDTKNHSQRVVNLSFRLAKQMGLKDDDLINIKRGALLHDIGKFAVPDNILQKPGKLTDEEWKIMRKHPEYAREILSTIPFLGPCVSIPYSHHESWDGSGYPQGLKGENIPLYARIFTIIDQWEALTSDRVYRKAWPVDKVISYIQENIGKIYDPQIASEFLKMIESDQDLIRLPPQAA